MEVVAVVEVVGEAGGACFLAYACTRGGAGGHEEPVLGE